MRKRTRLICFTVLFALSGCGRSPEIPVSKAERERTITAEEKAAAKLLALGAGANLQKISDPYELALRCHDAISSLGEILEKSGALNRQQQRAYEQVRELYLDNAMKLAKEEGKSVTQVRTDLEKLKLDGDGANSKNQLAIACLRRFA